jgi:hypothetical protein
MAKDTGALVLYGRGADFGSFKPFVDDFISTELGTRIPKSRIEVKNTERWKDFWEALGSFGQRFNIAELHIFSHSYGAGLSLGYKDPALQMERGAMLDTATMAGRKVTAQEVLATEKGIIFTDDLVDPMQAALAPDFQAMFVAPKLIKLWGCNSGVAGWLFSDPAGSRSVTDPAAPADSYYWRALNTINQPKPSVAQAFADYFKCEVHGATSGSHAEVKVGKAWVTSDEFRKQNKRWPNENDMLRLTPDKGTFQVFKPK